MEELIGNSDEEEGNILLDANMVVVNEHDEIIGELECAQGPDVQAAVDNFVQSFNNVAETLPENGTKKAAANGQDLNAAISPVDMEVDQTLQVDLPAEPVAPYPPTQPESPEPIEQNFDIQSDSNDDNVNSDNNDDDNDNGYIVESEGDSDNDEYDHNASIPLINYTGDTEVEEDVLNGWPTMPVDTGATIGPFMGEPTLTLDSHDKDPITYFNALFDTNMWTTLCDETNRYAHQTKLTTLGIFLSDFVRFCQIFSYSFYLIF